MIDGHLGLLFYHRCPPSSRSSHFFPSNSALSCDCVCVGIDSGKWCVQMKTRKDTSRADLVKEFWRLYAAQGSINLSAAYHPA